MYPAADAKRVRRIENLILPFVCFLVAHAVYVFDASRTRCNHTVVNIFQLVLGIR